MRIFSEAHYAFIEKRKYAYVASGLAVAVSIAAMLANVFLIGSWQNYGVDFTGGSLIQVRFETNVTAGDLRNALGGANAPEITRFGEEHEFTIRAPVREGASMDEVRQEMQGHLPGSPGRGYCVPVRACRAATRGPGQKRGFARGVAVQEAGVVSVHSARGSGPPVDERGARCPEADTKVGVRGYRAGGGGG